MCKIVYYLSPPSMVVIHSIFNVFEWNKCSLMVALIAPASNIVEKRAVNYIKYLFKKKVHDFFTHLPTKKKTPHLLLY